MFKGKGKGMCGNPWEYNFTPSIEHSLLLWLRYYGRRSKSNDKGVPLSPRHKHTGIDYFSSRNLFEINVLT